MNGRPADTWASASDNSPEPIVEFQKALPVRLIATPRASFETCCALDDLEHVVRENTKREAPFDHLPVVCAGVEGRETIIGLIELTSEEDRRGTVKQWMRPLSEGILIGADAGILDFVRDADWHPCRLVVSGSEIGGLVTLSDLQKLPVRAALFAAITQLEMIMAEAIRREFDESDEWIGRLSDNRQSKLRDKMSQSSDDNGFIEGLLFTDFCDKRTIIHKSQLFEGSKTAFKAEMEEVEKLRNLLVHASDYASAPAAAARICKTVRLIDQWVPRLMNGS